MTDWKNNPKLQHIDPQKLTALQLLADENRNKKPEELLNFFLLLKNQKDKIYFEPSEISAIIEVLKQDKSPHEIKKIEKIVQYLSMIR